MKKEFLGSRLLLPIFFACCMGNIMTSCIKDEELNSECDIESAYVHTDKVSDLFFTDNDTIVNVISTSNNVVFYVRRTADLTALSPIFKITKGATISPESGSTHDFSHGPIAYTVTSEDGQWTRQYNVQFKVNPNLMDFDFENFFLEKSRYVSEQEEYGFFYKWHEIDNEGKPMEFWDTGNSGYTLSNFSAMAEEYPSVMVPDGYDKAGVKLTTRATGELGKAFKKPIAAGNLFIGEFDVTQSMSNTLKTTKFGRPFDRKPMKLTGYYKYKPGEVFTNKEFKTVENRTDSGSIYSVFYRNEIQVGDHMEKMVLYGDDVQTNPQIVALAKFDDLKPTDDWTYFELDYKYRQGVDDDILNKLGYNLTVVFSSSRSGDTFEGAVGSTLYIDKVRIICDTTE